MKELFTFQNFPMTIIIALVAFSYFVFLSVILGG